MRIIAVIFILIAFRSFSQTSTIKVRKPLSQADAPWHVTFCGMYRGDVTREEVCKGKEFKISNNTEGLRIFRYDVTFRSNGKLFNWTASGDTLSTDIRKQLRLIDKNTRMFIDDIKAVLKNKDTVFLNPITLRVID